MTARKTLPPRRLEQPALERLVLDPLTPQDLLMTMVGSYGRRSPTLAAGGLRDLLAGFGFTSAGARIALTRMVDRGLFERSRDPADGRRVRYALTPRMHDLLDYEDRRIASLRAHVERVSAWTVVWHTIPETRRLERTRFARRLRFLGFGSLQEATWISPHDRRRSVNRLVAALSVEQHAVVMLGDLAGGVGLEGLIERTWDTTSLCERYERFCAAFSGFHPDRTSAALPGAQAFAVGTLLVHAFRRFAELDPGLPDGTLARPAARAEAVALFRTLYGALDAPAQRHFAEKVAR